MAIKLACWLLVIIVGTVTGIYVDEPLLYDTFPPGFVWSSATSAHQIEGAWNVDGKKISSSQMKLIQFKKLNEFIF